MLMQKTTLCNLLLVIVKLREQFKIKSNLDFSHRTWSITSDSALKKLNRMTFNSLTLNAMSYHLLWRSGAELDREQQLIKELHSIAEQKCRYLKYQQLYDKQDT